VDKRWYVDIRCPGKSVVTIGLNEGEWAIGRLPDNRIAIEHSSVSRRHASLMVEGERIQLVDLGSRFGTWVGKRRLLPHEPVDVTSGSLLRFGGCVARLRAVPTPLSSQEGAEREGDEARERDEEQVGDPGLLTDAKPELSLTPRRRMPVRVARPVPLVDAPVSSWLDYLPVVYREGDFIGRFLKIFETLWEPMEWRQDHIDLYFDPRTAPSHFLLWLASWLDVTNDLVGDESANRLLLLEAIELYRWRGTAYGLSRILEILFHAKAGVRTPAPAEVEVTVSLPAGSSSSKEAVKAIVLRHIPAHVRLKLDIVEVGGA